MKREAKKVNLKFALAGTYAENGDHASYHAIEAMEYYDIDLKSHRATNITSSKIEEMDVILCATVDHKRMVLMMYPKLKGKVYTMKEYAGVSDNGENLNISDPWGYSLQVFLDCAKEINMCIQKTLDKLLTNEK